MTENTILFVSYGLGSQSSSGGQAGSRRNLEVLRGSFPGRVIVASIGRSTLGRYDYNFNVFPRKWITLVFSVLGFIMYRPSVCRKVKKVIMAENVNWVYVDDSVHGKLVRRLKRWRPQVQILAFFHNVETDYYRNLVRLSGFRWLTFWWAATANEALTCKWADYLVGLTSRDSSRVFHRYGRSFQHLSPVSLDPVGTFEETLPANNSPMVLLFVGANFPANREAVEWFVLNVVPRVASIEFHVVGSGMEQLPKWIGQRPRVRVHGRVDSLSDYYIRASAVVAPLFSGSGQKVKIAEALMYGRTIFGTSEAFAGYEFDRTKVGAECNTADAFVEAIEGWKEWGYNPYCRDYFMKVHSNDAQALRFREHFWNRVLGE